MLLSLTTTTQPARDLGLLLRKHPDRAQTFELPLGVAHVFYPQATDERCTATLLLDLDPIALVRGRASSTESGLLDAYVNDRPYAVSSFMSVAIARLYGTALGGRSDRPELVERVLELEAVFEPVRRDDDALPARLFGALGYTIVTEALGAPGANVYERITLAKKTTLRELLSHLYVMLPVMDDEKHYWIGDDEVEKLFRHGAAWLPTHPERDLIARRYLKRAPAQMRAALARLRALEEASEPSTRDVRFEQAEVALERPLRLQDIRIETVVRTLRATGAKSVIDLGCGEGDLILALAREPGFERLLGVDVSLRDLTRAKERLTHVPMPMLRRENTRFIHASLVYADARFRGFDAAAALEVVEHIDPERLATFERVIFAEARPRVVVLTTPNRDYNVLFPKLINGALRHADHRYERTRAEFRTWAGGIAERCDYTVRFEPVGEEHPLYGPPTQMAVFECK